MATMRWKINGVSQFDYVDPDLDELLGWARKKMTEHRRAAVEIEIERDDGTKLGMPQIIETLSRRENELRDRPRRQ
jgi:hypothetical protein